MATRVKKYTPEEILNRFSEQLEKYRPAILTDEILNSLPKITRELHSDSQLYAGYRGYFPKSEDFWKNTYKLEDDILYPANRFFATEYNGHNFVWYPFFLVNLINKIFVKK